MPSTELGTVLAALGRAFGRLDARWYLFGAQAVIVHGRPRATADVDVTVDLDLPRWDDLVGALGGEGLTFRVEDAEGFARRTRVVPALHEETGFPVDIVLAGPTGLEQSFFDRRVRLNADGIGIPVISAEDLVVTKILAGRPRDLDDARGVIAIRGDLFDDEHVRTLLSRLEAALGRSDLLRELERLGNGPTGGGADDRST